MPGYYTYLISSLPMLHFGLKAPVSFEEFLRVCSPLLSKSDMDILKKSSITGEYDYREAQPALAKWRAFDTALRNELVRIRASRKHVDSTRYIRTDGYADASVAHMAINAYRSPSILEAERMLDQERWKFLEELAIGHYFDVDALVVYAHKLLMLERWEKVRDAEVSFERHKWQLKE